MLLDNHLYLRDVYGSVGGGDKSMPADGSVELTITVQG